MATLEARLTSLVNSIGGDIKVLRNSIGTLSALTTTAKGSIVLAVNELEAELAALAGNAGAAINDAATDGNTTQTWSANKIFDELVALRNGILGGVGPAFDTLNELSVELADQDSVVNGLLTSVGEKVSFTVAQTLTAGQKTTALGNIGAASATDLSNLSTSIGNPDVDLVALYTTAKA